MVMKERHAPTGFELYYRRLSALVSRARTKSCLAVFGRPGVRTAEFHAGGRVISVRGGWWSGQWCHSLAGEGLLESV
jgi:hypothetical protein